LESKRRLVKVGGLLRIADIKLDVISPLKWQEILFDQRSFLGSCDCCWHNLDLQSCALHAQLNYKINNSRPQGWCTGCPKPGEKPSRDHVRGRQAELHKERQKLPDKRQQGM
jgi:hypothetical protein